MSLPKSDTVFEAWRTKEQQTGGVRDVGGQLYL